MTFGHLVVHMAETNYLLCSKAAAVPAPRDEEIKDTDSKDKLLAALQASFDFCSDALAKMDDSRLAETTEIFPGRQGSRAWASLILAGTWADHYAETAMYLRLNERNEGYGRFLFVHLTFSFHILNFATDHRYTSALIVPTFTSWQSAATDRR
jgi:hypothetical protein